MSPLRTRARGLATPLLVGFVGLLVTACFPPEPPPYGIAFYPPTIGYVNKQYTPTASATSGLPVSYALDASSTGCSFIGGVVFFEAVGSCVINADQAGNAAHPAAPQVRRTINIYECPTMRSGIWSGPLGITANVVATGSSFTGFVDLSAQGYGIQTFAGTLSCEVVRMTFNSTPLSGTLSYDGSTIYSNYSGIDIILYAPA